MTSGMPVEVTMTSYCRCSKNVRQRTVAVNMSRCVETLYLDNSLTLNIIALVGKDV